MSPSERVTDRSMEWPERRPVVGPAVGALLASISTAIALAEGDGIAGTVFVAFAVTMGRVSARNHRAVGADR